MIKKIKIQVLWIFTSLLLAAVSSFCFAQERLKDIENLKQTQAVVEITKKSNNFTKEYFKKMIVNLISNSEFLSFYFGKGYLDLDLATQQIAVQGVLISIKYDQELTKEDHIDFISFLSAIHSYHSCEPAKAFEIDRLNLISYIQDLLKKEFDKKQNPFPVIGKYISNIIENSLNARMMKFILYSWIWSDYELEKQFFNISLLNKFEDYLILIGEKRELSQLDSLNEKEQEIFIFNLSQLIRISLNWSDSESTDTLKRILKIIDQAFNYDARLIQKYSHWLKKYIYNEFHLALKKRKILKESFILKSISVD